MEENRQQESMMVSMAHVNVDDPVSNDILFSNDYVQYGDDDDYPDRLNFLLKKAPLHGSLVKSIAQMIAGRGIEGATIDDIPIVNSRGQRLDFIIREAALEIKLNGYCYFEVLFRKGKDTIVNVIPARFVRNGIHAVTRNPSIFYVDAPEDDYDVEDGFQKSRAVSIHAFDGKRKHSMIYLRLPDTSTVSYAAPDYEGGLDDINLDIVARNHKHNSIASGFLPSALVNFKNGDPGSEKRTAIEKKFTDKYTGSEGKARIVFMWNNPGSEATEMKTFEPPNIAKFFKELTPELQQSILNAHRVTSPLLFGVRYGQGGLGNNQDEMVQAYDIFNETVIRPYQYILFGGINMILEFIGFSTPISVIEMVPKSLEQAGETKERIIDKEQKGGRQPRLAAVKHFFWNLLKPKKDED